MPRTTPQLGEIHINVRDLTMLASPFSKARRFHTALMLLSVISAGHFSPWTNAARAQSNTQPGAINNNLSIMLLSNPKIQKELKLSQSQIEETAAPAQQLVDEVLTLSFDPEYRKQPDKLKAAAKKLKAREQVLIEKLNPAQQLRLKQLFYQEIGIRLFQTAEAEKILKLSKEQKQDIQGVIGAMQKDLLAMVKEIQKSGAGLPSKETREANRKKSNGIVSAATEKINQVLSEQQREALTKMKGKPFPLFAAQAREHFEPPSKR